MRVGARLEPTVAALSNNVIEADHDRLKQLGGGAILSWDRIAEVTRFAAREMWAGRPGPAPLEVLAPVLYAVGDAAWRAVPIRSAAPPASERQFDKAADLLASARRPVIVAGSGVERARQRVPKASGRAHSTPTHSIECHSIGMIFRKSSACDETCNFA